MRQNGLEEGVDRESVLILKWIPCVTLGKSSSPSEECICSINILWPPPVCQHCPRKRASGLEIINMLISHSLPALPLCLWKVGANKHKSIHKTFFFSPACPSWMDLLRPHLVAREKEMEEEKVLWTSVLYPLIFTVSWDYYPHATDEETEARRGKMSQVMPQLV